MPQIPQQFCFRHSNLPSDPDRSYVPLLYQSICVAAPNAENLCQLFNSQCKGQILYSCDFVFGFHLIHLQQVKITLHDLRQQVATAPTVSQKSPLAQKFRFPYLYFKFACLSKIITDVKFQCPISFGNYPLY